MIKHTILLIFFVLLCSIKGMSQSVAYKLITTEMESSSIVKVTLMVYGKSAKIIDTDARYAAIRVALFDGCPSTSFSKPLLDDGEATSFEQHPNYFDNLYNFRLDDFISECSAVSKFKKGDNKKGTLYEVCIKVLQLRKDLEKNGIRTKMGI